MALEPGLTATDRHTCDMPARLSALLYLALPRKQQRPCRNKNISHAIAGMSACSCACCMHTSARSYDRQETIPGPVPKATCREKAIKKKDPFPATTCLACEREANDPSSTANQQDAKLKGDRYYYPVPPPPGLCHP